MGRKEAQEGGDTCVHLADSLHCAAETHSIVKQLYSSKEGRVVNVIENHCVRI